MGFWVCGGAAEADASMKALPKRKGNLSADLIAVGLRASMKVPPKRKGNHLQAAPAPQHSVRPQ